MLESNAQPVGLSAAVDTARTSPFPVSATTALRSWLQAQRRTHAADVGFRTADVRRALRPVCDDARRRGARVEQLIVMLKDLWATIPPDSGGNGHSSADREILDGIVRVCIEEFYAPQGPAAEQSAARVPADGTSRASTPASA